MAHYHRFVHQQFSVSLEYDVTTEILFYTACSPVHELLVKLNFQVAQLSALQGGLAMAISGRLKLEDNILRIL